MWQEIAIIVIGLLTVAYVGRKMYNVFSHPKRNGGCGCCNGCSIKKRP